MTWEIALGVIGLGGFVLTIAKCSIELTKAFTKLSISCDNLTEKFDTFENRNSDNHKRLWEYNDKQDKIIAEHEVKLLKLMGE